MNRSYFYFGRNLYARACRRLNNETVSAIWSGFCGHACSLSLKDADGFCFEAGDADSLIVPEGKDFSVRVTARGIAVAARDYGGLVRGLMALMMRIETLDLSEGRESFRLAECSFESQYTVSNRMIHFCVFPETSLGFLKKAVRLAGVMQYTHVVLEFWGMLRYDCLRELSWDMAYSKTLVGGVVREIEDLGMEAIPMMNHLGHATGCRECGGKHVVLDQNPRLATLFTPDGWSWNVDNPKALELLRCIRKELYALFPNSKYIHLGCDEVYSYGKSKESQARMCSYLHDLMEEVRAEGRRPIIWGDMLLNAQACGVPDVHNGVKQGYFCGSDSPENAQQLIAAIPKDTVIADWHYDVPENPVKTSIYLKDHGFDVLGTPWSDQANCRAHAKTAQDHHLMGILVTTWHTLAQKLPQIVSHAVICGAYHSPWAGIDTSSFATETATLLRKVYFANGNYPEAGWTDKQIFRQADPMS